MTETLNDLVRNIESLLTHIFPGAVALIVIFFSDINHQEEWFKLLIENPWAGAIIVTLFGFFLHALNNAFLEDCVCFATVKLIRWFSPSEVPEKLKRMPTAKIVRELEQQSCKRRASDDSFLNELQRSLDSQAASLIFLLCSSYSFIIIPVFMAGTSSRISASDIAPIIVVGVVLLIVAIMCDIKYTKQAFLITNKHEKN